MPFLESFSAKDFGVFMNGHDFVSVQTSDEEATQEITWFGGFGTDGPVARSVRASDESTVSFSFIVLKEGAKKNLTRKQIMQMKDFELAIRVGQSLEVYKNCNWRRVTARNTLTSRTIDVDASIPGYAGP